MIIGLGDAGKPYVDLSQFLDYSEFEQLHPEINAGIALGKDTLAIEGTFFKYDPHERTSFTHCNRSLLSTYSDYKNDQTVPADSKAKLWESEKGVKLQSTNKFSRYLKLKYGAYDSMWGIHLTEAPWFKDCVAEDIIQWNHAAAKLFPKTIKWVNDKVIGNVFKEGTLKMISIMYVENDGIPNEHRDGRHNKEHKVNRNDYGPPDQMIHLRNPERGFYIFDPENLNKYFVDSWACIFNTSDWHSTFRNIYPSWSLRIDGEFTDKVKEVIKENKWNT